MDNKSNTFYLLILLTLILFFSGYKILNMKMPLSALNAADESDINNNEYRIIKGEKFYILKDEYIDSENNINTLVRLYLVYDGTSNNIEGEPYPYIVGITNVQYDDIAKLKEELVQANSNSLKLMPNTIVSDEVINSWRQQQYNPNHEFYDECPEGLSYADLLNK